MTLNTAIELYVELLEAHQKADAGAALAKQKLANAEQVLVDELNRLETTKITVPQGTFFLRREQRVSIIPEGRRSLIEWLWKNKRDLLTVNSRTLSSTMKNEGTIPTEFCQVETLDRLSKRMK